MFLFCFSFFVVPHNRGETEASLRPGRPGNSVFPARERRINCVDSGEEYLHSLSQFSEMRLQPQRELSAICRAARDDYYYFLTSAPKRRLKSIE